MNFIKRVGIMMVGLLVCGVPANAFTITPTNSTVYGNHRVTYGSVSFDASYPTGGEAATKAALSNNQIVNTTLFVGMTNKSGYSFEYNYSGETVKVFGAPAVSAHTHTITTVGHTHTVTGTVGSHTHSVSGNTSGHIHGIVITNSALGTPVEFTAGSFNVDGATDNAATDSSFATFSATSGGTSPSFVGSNTTNTDGGTTSSNGASAATTLAEVPNATNLSTVTGVRYVIFGI